MAIVSAAWSATGHAADLRVVVTGLRSDAGELRVAVCPQAEFLGAACPFSARTSSERGAVVIAGVPPGKYAVQAFHDENGNGELDRARFRPLEGMGFSRDAPMRFGPPSFDAAAFTLEEPGGTLTLTMRYFE